MVNNMEKTTNFVVSLEFFEATAEDVYKNPLLSYVKLIFADDKPNSNNQGISQKEFPNLIKSMVYMPIKAKYETEAGLGGHDDAQQIGIMTAGQQEGNKIVAVGALYNDEFPEVIEYFKTEVANGRPIFFSWELRYRDSEVIDSIEWLKDVTTKAVTAVKSPAYVDRTPLLSLSSKDELINMIEKELLSRGEKVGKASKK